MKLLIITYSYTPDLTPRAFRWAAVAKMLVQRGHEVHVLCAAPGPTDEVVDGVIVHRVKDGLLSKVKPAGAHVPSSLANDRPGLRRRLRTWFLQRVIRTLWRTFYWPDYACGWIFPATRVGKTLVSENEFDWVISSSHPFSGHLAGLLVKRRAKTARWLVDISDPFSLMEEPSPNNRHLYAWLNKVVEAQVISRANAISVTTEATAALYSLHFKCAANKPRVIPPLMSLPPAPPRSAEADGVWRLVFVGTLYRKLRSPRFLLACMAALQIQFPLRKIELHFYGAVNDCADDLVDCPESIRSSLFVHGLVPRDVVIQAMVDADLLVNIGNDSETQLASKVVEYMAMGRPILNILSIINDISVDVLREYPAVLTVMSDPAGPSANFIAALGNFLANPPSVSPAISSAMRKRYSPECIGLLYLEVIKAGLV